jgi:hypothetical protein
MMRYYILMPIMVLMLLIVQTTILDMVFMGKIRIEISLILVIYAGFYMDIFRGGFLVLLLGFCLDCMISPVPGLYLFFYMVVFLLSKNVVYRIYSDGMTFIMLFTFLCALLEGIIMFLLYQFLFGVNISHDVLDTYLPQALAIAVLGPACFTLFDQFEVLRINGANENKISHI